MVLAVVAGCYVVARVVAETSAPAQLFLVASVLVCAFAITFFQKIALRIRCGTYTRLDAHIALLSPGALATKISLHKIWPITVLAQSQTEQQ